MTAFDLIREGFGVWIQTTSQGSIYTSPVVFTMLFLFGFLVAAMVRNIARPQQLPALGVSDDGRTLIDNANTARLFELETEVANQKAALNRLTETLSTTFAHLSAGLAIFDANRALHLFNPALCDLLNLDPVWLAGRPHIADFLSKLREKRTTPEMKDFLKWRKHFTEFQSAANQSNHESEWVLPDGRVLRVTLQPHPLGAIAVLFEDISAQILAERRHRQEIELNQCILDKISDAVFVIDASGAASFMNDAFEDLLGVNISNTLADFSVFDVGACWILAPESTAFWSELKIYVSRIGRIGAWEKRLIAHDGKSFLAQVSPMPDGSTLVTLCQDRDTRALNHSAQTTDTFRLTSLQSLLGQRNVRLDVSNFDLQTSDVGDTIKARHLIWYQTISASNMCRDGGQLTLTSRSSGPQTTIHCYIPAMDRLNNPKESLADGLLTQLVSQPDERRIWSYNAAEACLSFEIRTPLSRTAS